MDNIFITAAQRRREQRKIAVLEYIKTATGAKYEIVKYLAKVHKCHENTIRNIINKAV
jgi:hypothetical protein